MTNELLESPTPEVDADQAERIVTELYGISGHGTALEGERDRNYRIDGPDGSLALKIGNIADRPDAVEMQVLAMEHARAFDPTLPIPEIRRTLAGHPVGAYRNHAGNHPVQLVTFLEGPHPVEVSADLHRSLGFTVARLSRALRGFRHPAMHRSLDWDVRRLGELAPKIEYVETERRSLFEKQLARFESGVGERLDVLPAQVIHGDVHAANIIVDPFDTGRVVGIVDFGDITHGARVLDVAITAGYQTFGTDPVDALVAVVAAYHMIDPLDPAEIDLIPDLVAARLTQSYLISRWRAGLHPENAAYINADAEEVYRALEVIDSHDFAEIASEIHRACATTRPPRVTLSEAMALRRDRLGPGLALTYDEPLRLESASGVWLTDVDGNRLLDAYNNVPHVGHNHPQVVNALTAQIRRLTTNTRYLVDEVAVYADRLCSLLPGDLSVVLFVNSGSEANDVAYQIARSITGRRGMVVTEHAYHGTTAITAMMSPEELGWPRLEAWSAPVGGATTLGAPDAAARIEGELDEAFARLGTADTEIGMFICDGVFSSDGIFEMPTGYLATAYAKVRAAGGLCVADEVQSGFGRIGSSFWGFAQDGVIPDIVTLGKPMGNGHPMGAVITTPAIAAEFAAKWHFFSTFAGSPVAAAAGMAVLDVLDRERLPQRADEVGEHLRRGIAALAHPAIVAVRGPGLFIGVEMTDKELARSVANDLRRIGVVVGRTGKGENVIKIRPPLVFTEAHADRVIHALEQVLG